MISKKTFCNAINYIKEQEQIDRQVSKALELVSDGYFIYGTNSKYLIALIDILKEVLQDKGDTISWWLWELTDDHIIEEIDGSKQWNIQTAEDLYDYLIENYELQ